jgi:hypothetical protein
VPNVDAIPLVSEWRLVAADAKLESGVEVEVEVGVEQLDNIVKVLE